MAQLPVHDIQQVTPVGGGDINDAYHLQTRDADYFLLVQPGQPQSFYNHEIDGLNLLGAVVNVPHVIASGQIESDAYLLIDYIPSGQGDQAQLGQMVAHLHQTISPNARFGYKTSFYSGNFEVRNDWSDNWCDFFLQTRLQPLAQNLQQKGLFLPEWQVEFQHVVVKFQKLMQQHQSKPALLHGDLWAGNYLFADDGTPYLIDPSVWYGDREFDLALTTVFGGYNERFYEGYQQVYPLASGWQARIEFYRLYYLMLHTYLFGADYQPSVSAILQQY
ncbi:fructosamine kinase family protein [Agrilactobacillus fermenti]|uniref:fructosamine kinase family protein n=1 Tax=Agrilactobacillus fermenti TaxID=2586909 RepID=UPI001E4C06D4